MDQLTIRMPTELVETIEERASEDNVSKSESARKLLRMGTEYEQLQTENERLRREKRQILEQRSENTELVLFAENERERRGHERARRQQSVFRRAWWWVAGEPSEVEEDTDSP